VILKDSVHHWCKMLGILMTAISVLLMFISFEDSENCPFVLKELDEITQSVILKAVKKPVSS